VVKRGQEGWGVRGIAILYILLFIDEKVVILQYVSSVRIPLPQ